MKRKILLAYDGSPYADNALHDLQHLGYDNDSVQLEVISAADVFFLPSNGSPKPLLNTTAVSATVRRLEAQASSGHEIAKSIAQFAASNIRERFPHWKVSTFVTDDSPTWGILNRINQSKPHLVILGSHGRTGVQRFLLGSVSQRIVTEADCNVRIVKKKVKKSKKEKVLICIDHSEYSKGVIREVFSRSWPPSTEIKIFSVIERPFISTLIETNFTLDYLSSAVKDELKKECNVMNAQLSPYFPKNSKVVIEARRGNPKRAIIEEADDWGATVIFLGAQGCTDLENNNIGSVASTITAHAPCTVEVVRVAPVPSAFKSAISRKASKQHIDKI